MPLKCITRDLTAVFSASDFGVEGTAFRMGGLDPIPGIFDDEDVEQAAGDGVAVIVPQATFTCAASNVPGLADGEAWVIEGKNLKLKFWQRDGAGMVTLFFEGQD